MKLCMIIAHYCYIMLEITILIADCSVFSSMPFAVLLVALRTSRLLLQTAKRLLDTVVPSVIDWIVVATRKIDMC